MRTSASREFTNPFSLNTSWNESLLPRVVMVEEEELFAASLQERTAAHLEAGLSTPVTNLCQSPENTHHYHFQVSSAE